MSREWWDDLMHVPDIEELKERVLAIERQEPEEPQSQVRAEGWCGTVFAHCCEQGQFSEAVDWAGRGLRFAEAVQDESGQDFFRINLAFAQAVAGVPDIDTAGLPSSSDDVPLQYALQLMQTYSILGNRKMVQEWQAKILDILGHDRVDTSDQILLSVQRARQSDLSARESVDATQAENRRFNILSLAMLAGLVIVGAVPVLWRYREKSRLLSSLQSEVVRREEEEKRNAVLQEQLLASQRLESAGTLAAGVAHDVNNALMAVVGFTNMAGREQDAAKRKDHLQTVLDAAGMAANTTRGLLTFARMETSEFTATDLVPLLEESHAMLARISSAAVQFELRIEPDEPVFCHGDPCKLKQMLMNLVLNARDAVRADGGNIALSLEVDHSGQSVIRVKDDGVGIPPDLQDRIFDPFFTTKERGKGTGLGLAIVHGIVSDHGGTIAIESTTESGTLVTVTLPGCENHPALPTTTDLDGAGRTLLLAEDNPAVMAVLRHYLEAMGFEVVRCVSGDEVLRKYEKHEDQIVGVVLDIDLPAIDGVRCLEKIRDCASTLVPAILISGRRMAVTDEQTRFLTKPVVATEFAAALAEVLPVVQRPVQDLR